MLKNMLPLRPITKKKKMGRPVGSKNFSTERLEKKQAAMRNRKYGPHYNKLLDYYRDNVPVSQLLREQEGKCAICLKLFSERRKPVGDHCHITFYSRGLLCNNCNVLLGVADDSVTILLGAIAYLKKFRELHTQLDQKISVDPKYWWVKKPPSSLLPKKDGSAKKKLGRPSISASEESK